MRRLSDHPGPCEVFTYGHFKGLRAGEAHAYSDRIVDNVDVAHDRSSGLGGECVCAVSYTHLTLPTIYSV